MCWLYCYAAKLRALRCLPHCTAPPSPQDLVAEGMIALEHAAVRYRPDRGASFSTFAATAISNGMTRAIHNLSRAIRLPAHQYAGAALLSLFDWCCSSMQGPFISVLPALPTCRCAYLCSKLLAMHCCACLLSFRPC